MSLEILTKKDLEEFKSELFEEMNQMFQKKETINKVWLRSSEVREMLKISTGTLQTLRINGTLQYSKIGGTLFSNQADIEKMMTKLK